MITDLPKKRMSALSQWQTFLRVLPARWRRKSTGTDMEQNYVTVTAYVYRALAERRTVKAKFHYTDPTGLCRRPARTNGVSRRCGSFGSARARVVESSYKQWRYATVDRWVDAGVASTRLSANIDPSVQSAVCLSVCLRDRTENDPPRPAPRREASLHRTLSRRSSSSRHNEPMRCPAPQPADRPVTRHLPPPGHLPPLEN